MIDKKMAEKAADAYADSLNPNVIELDLYERSYYGFKAGVEWAKKKTNPLA